MSETKYTEPSFLTLSSYELPEVKEDKYSDYIKFGEEDDYFKRLIELYHNSPTNNAIINGMIELIYGGGLDAKDKSIKPEAYAQFMTMFRPQDVRRLVGDLKQMGNAAFQVIYNKDGSVNRAEHFPVETLRAEKANDKGEIKAYYYCKNWEESRPNDEHKRIPAFGYGGKGVEAEIYYIKPYRAGFFYYAPVDYQGSLAYAEVEQELAEYHISNINGGFSPTFFISFNNGIPDNFVKDQIEAKLKRKFSGAKGEKIVIEFNNSPEQAAKIEAIQLQDAHSQYEFIANEAMRKIMLGHRVTSPMLLGIKDNTGLGNNADELKTASQLFEATVITPFRLMVLDAVHEILGVNNISLDVYFDSLSPFDEKQVNDSIQMAAQDDSPILTETIEQGILGNLDGLGEPLDALDDEYELIGESPADDEDTDDDLERDLNEYARQEEAKTLMSRVRRAFGLNDDSYQDTEWFKIRYKYEVTTKGPKPKGESRPLCKNLISKAQMYRKEDIRAMSSKGGAESKGEPYDVFRYKGGAWCQHGWVRRIYKKKAKKDGTPYKGGVLITSTKASIYETIGSGAKLEQGDYKKAIKAPRDTIRHGYK